MKTIVAFFLLSFMAVANAQNSNTPPPTLDPAEQSANGTFLVEGNWSKFARGWNVLVLHITDENQKPIAGANVAMVYEMVGMAMNPPQNPVEDKGDGYYEEKVFLGMKGDWKFDATIKVGDSQDTYSKVTNLKF